MFTKHAKDKMADTGLTVSDVTRAVRYGFVKKVSATFTFWDDKTVVIIAPRIDPIRGRRTGHSIVTVYPVEEYKGEGFINLRKRWVKEIKRSG